MAATPSSMLPLGTKAPPFALYDTENNLITLASLQDCQAKVIMFICNHCPYVQHILPALAAFGRDFAARGVGVVAINANDTEAYPQDGLEPMAALKAALGLPFPYLLDSEQTVAKAYQAACTPDFFLFDASDALVYRGQFDDSRPGQPTPVTGKDLRLATEAVLAGKPVAFAQKPSIGCNIKWKKH